MQITILEEIRSLKALLLDRPHDRWLNIKETVLYTNLSDSTIRRNVRKQTLKASTSTGKLLFKKSAIDRWLDG